MSTTSERGSVYEHVQASPEFVDLKSRLRRFVFWYLLFVLLASYAPEFMATPVLENINVGLILGLLQFVSTFAIATAYVWYANKHLDPAAERLRNRIEGVR